LNFRQKLKTPPTLFYSITCDNGPIQELKFCPSGGFNEAVNQMGLLAVTTVSGFVNIYAVPFLVDSPTSASPVISLPPALVLTLSRNVDESCQAATSLVWTKAQHHMSVAAGFSNGLVAVWNLGGPSKLLRFERNGLSYLAPVHVIPAHQSAVTVVKFHHMHDTRYLMTASLDKKVKVFDLDSGFVPLEISAAITKSRILSADWNQNWSAFELGMDESLLLGKQKKQRKC
jgi:general transcription factor 3C polypeptide 2